ncbi:hypothetical protein Ct61P_02843 [Colletotrichum tofieldiae]|nr:hypothetical protein Ct61P_02843 [Colletotrichum tofieldiae]
MAVWPLDVRYVSLNSLISEQPSSTGPLVAASASSAGGPGEGDAAKIRFKVATSARTSNSLNIRKVDMLEID